MSESIININIPSDLYVELNSLPTYSGKLKQKLQTDLAVGMFVSKEISLARAAEFAGMSLADFTDLLCKLDVPVVEYSEPMLEDDIAFSKKYIGA